MTAAEFQHVLTNAAKVALLIVGAVACFTVLSVGQVIIAPITLAVVVGMMFGPLADFLERRGIKPALSAGVVVLILLALIGIATVLFIGPLSEWVKRGPLLWEKLQTQLTSLKQPLESLTSIQEQLKSVMGGDTAVTVQVQDGGPITNIALMAPNLLADMLLFLAGLYFFLATRHHLRFSILSLFFSRRIRWRVAHVFRDVELKVSKFLVTAAIINLGVGVATAAATFAIGLPSPLLWGALAFIMNFIPYVGQAVMFVILFAVGLGTQTSLVGIILPVIAYAAINLTADQVVFPHLVGRALTLNPFIIFVSIAFWLWLWGPVGGLIAVPSLLVLQSLIMSTFPETAKVPELVQRKVEAKQAADAAAMEAAAAEAKAEALAKQEAKAEAKAEALAEKAEKLEAEAAATSPDDAVTHTPRNVAEPKDATASISAAAEPAKSPRRRNSRKPSAVPGA